MVKGAGFEVLVGEVVYQDENEDEDEDVVSGGKVGFLWVLGKKGVEKGGEKAGEKATSEEEGGEWGDGEVQ
jgi:hypothetical protein